MLHGTHPWPRRYTNIGMINKSNLIQISVIAIILIIGGIVLIYDSNRTLKVNSQTNIGATIDAFIVSSSNELSEQKLNQIQKTTKNSDLISLPGFWSPSKSVGASLKPKNDHGSGPT